MKPTTLIKRTACAALAAFLLFTGVVPYTPAVYAQEREDLSVQMESGVDDLPPAPPEGGTQATVGEEEPGQTPPALPEGDVQAASDEGELGQTLPGHDGTEEAGHRAKEPANLPALLAAPVLLNVNSTPGAVVTEAPGVNLVNNPGFEASNTLESWGAERVSEQTVPTLAHSGAKCVAVNAGLNQVAFAFSGLNATYDRAAAVTAGMWVNLTAAADASKVTIVLERKTDENNGAYNLTKQPEAKTGWQKVEFTGAAMGVACTEQVIKFEVQSGNEGAVYFDDAYVCTENKESIQWLRNAGFEEDSGWSSGATTVQGGGRNSSRAFQLSNGVNIFQSTAWWGSGAPAYDGTKAMQFSVWAKSDDAGATLTLKAEVKNTADATVQMENKTFSLSGEWQQYVLDVPSVGDVANWKETLFHISAAGGAVLVDDAALTLPQTPVEPPFVPEGDSDTKTPGFVTVETGNVLQNPGFENGFDNWGCTPASEQNKQINTNTDYTYSGSGSLIVSGAANLWNNLPGTADPNAAVTVSAWVCLEKTEDASKVKLSLKRTKKISDTQTDDLDTTSLTTENVTAGTWQKVTFEVPARSDKDATGAVLLVDVTGTLAGKVYLDDFSVVVKEPEPEPYKPIPSNKDKTAGTVAVTAANGNVLLNPGFEEGTAGSGNNEAKNWGGITTAEDAAARLNTTDDTRTYMGAGSVIVSGAVHLWNNLPATVNAGGETTVSAWVYLENAGDAENFHLTYQREEDNEVKNYTAESFTGQEGWQQVSFTVPEYETGEASNPVLVVDVTGTLAGKIYLDDFSIVVKEAEPEPTPDPIPSKEDKTEGTVVTGQPEDNLVRNPGFEEKNDADGHKMNWGLVNGAAINTDTDYAHSGAYSVVCEEHEYGSSVFNVLPNSQDANAATTLSAWVYLEYPADADKVSLRLKRIDGDGKDVEIYTAQGFTSATAKAGWQIFTLEVPERTQADSAQLVVVLDVAAGATGRVFLDDFYVKKVEKVPTYAEGYLTNPGLDRVNEAGTEVNNWGLMPGWDTVTGAVCADVVHTAGGHSVRIPQADVQRELIQSSAWIDPMLTRPTDPSKPMLLTVWVKYENITGDGIWLRSERKQGSTAKTAQSKHFTGTSNGWEKLELYIPPNDGDFDECIVGLAVAPGSGTVWVDDFDLQVTDYREPTPEEMKGSTETAQRLYGADALQSGANWLTNPGFEQGVLDWGSIGSAVVTNEEVHSGSSAIRLMGDAHLWNNVATDVDKNAGFRLSFWVCLTAPSDAQFIEFYVDRKDEGDQLIRRYTAYPEAYTGWQQIVIDIPAEDYFRAGALVVGMDARARLDPVYLDDFYLTKTDHNDPLDNYIANWSFEQKDGGREKWGAIPGWGNGLDVVSGEGHNRERALRMTLSENDTLTLFQSNSWGGVQKYRADQNMILSVFLRTSGITGDGALLKAERKNGDELVGEPLLSERVTGSWNGWTLLELYIPATDEPVDDIIVPLEVAPGTGVLYADSWGLYPTDLPAPAGSAGAGEEESDGALLKNGGVEQLNPDGTVTHWDVWPGNPEEGQRNSYSTTEFKHSGERSVCIELVYSNPQAIYQYRLPEDNAFDFNADYIFSAWVKMDGVSVVDGNGVKIGVKRKGADGNEYNVYQSVPMGTCDWTKVELEVPKEPGVNIVQYDVIFDIGCGTGKIYFDDFELTPAELTAAGPEFAFREVEFTAADLLPAAGAASGFAARDIALLGASGVCLIVAAALGGTAAIRFKKRRNG